MQAKVADLISRGADYETIGKTLNISAKTASVHVSLIADLLPNPDELKPYVLVLLWAAGERWKRERSTAA